MTHNIHGISVAEQIGKYSDAIAVGSSMRWLLTPIYRPFRLPSSPPGRCESAAVCRENED